MAKNFPQPNWPATSEFGEVTLTFSGTFEPGRLNGEFWQKKIHRAGQILLGLIITLGAASAVWTGWLAWQGRTLAVLWQQTPFNLSAAVAALFSCYAWARARQHRLDQHSLNLLQLSDKTGQKDLDVYSVFNERAKDSWDQAARLAQGRLPTKSADLIPVSAIDLMLALLTDPGVETLFYRLGVSAQDLTTYLRNYHLLIDGADVRELADVPFCAFEEAVKLHNKTIDPLMLLCALKITLPEEHVLQAVFFNLDVSLEDLEAACAWIFNLRLLREDLQLNRKLALLKPANETNRGLTALPTPYLDRFSRDLTSEARYGSLPIALGRGADIAALFTLLGGERKNICIKGEPGTGRATLIHELAYKMATEQVPMSLSDMRLIQLETAAILGNPDRAEQALTRALQEAERSGNIAIVIPDIHAYARATTASGLSLLEILADFLTNHRLTAFATTTNEDYTDYLKSVSNFDATFTSYELRALSRQDILLACCIKASVLEFQNKCAFRYPAIKLAVELTDLYIKDANQPQKAIKVLAEAAARCRRQKSRLVTEDLIQTVVSDKTHIPAQTLTTDESNKLLNLEDDLAKHIIGQQAALTAVAEGLRRARSGLTDSNRPLASFLFLGPTGVGKTEVAKTLASLYFGDPRFLLRLDMSEYQGEEGLEKLIGSEHSRTDSPLIKHLKNYPFCLLLCDEFEKASPQVLNLFLQILEDGRLTSGKGELIDVTHALIIATSNAGSAEITAGIKAGIKAGQSIDRIKARLLEEILLTYYPPELLNRFDGVIIFSTLTPDNITAIVHLQLEALKSHLRAKGIKVDFSLAVARDIAEKAYDPALGARPIRRYIQDHVETFIAKLLLQKSLRRGSEIQIDLQDGKLIIA